MTMNRRLAELDGGTVRTIPWAEVRGRLIFKSSSPALSLKMPRTGVSGPPFRG